jgi:hypothetical protein
MLHRMFPPGKEMMSYHTSATTAASFSLGTIENRSGGWCNRWNTIQNRKSPDDDPLDKILIPTKNDDRYAFGKPQTPHIFANAHHPSWPS